MGANHVHEFMSLDGVVDAPTWTFDYGFHPKMGEAHRCGHGTFPRHPAQAHDLRDVRAVVVDADRGGRSRGAVLQRHHHQVRRLCDAHDCDVEELEDHRAVRPRRDPPPEGRGRRRSLCQRRPGLVNHSDQGSEYVSLRFGERCRLIGIHRSMGSTGDCFDNAVAESFFATLEKDLLRRRSFATRQETRTAVFDCIEAFYNPIRLTTSTTCRRSSTRR